MPNKRTILAVDDTRLNLAIITEYLSEKYNLVTCNRPSKALDALSGNLNPALILLDVEMPEMNGYELCKKIKSNPDFEKIPVIFCTANENVEDEQKGFEVGAVDYIKKPISPPILLERVKNHLALFNQNCALEELIEERTQKFLDARLEVIQRLAWAGEYRDDTTGNHTKRIANYAREVAKELNISSKWTYKIYISSPLHDVGKIGIPDSILLKPGKLTDSEMEQMKRHTIIGSNLLDGSSCECLQMAQEIALNHHERWDGTGYPNHLVGEDIPLSARLVAACDVFDALTSARPYKGPWSIDDAMTFLKENSGTHFDPQIIEIITRIEDKFRKIKQSLVDSYNPSI